MSNMNEISFEIRNHLDDDSDPRIVAKVMEIPIQWVYTEQEKLISEEISEI